MVDQWIEQGRVRGPPCLLPEGGRRDLRREDPREGRGLDYLDNERSASLRVGVGNLADEHFQISTRPNFSSTLNALAALNDLGVLLSGGRTPRSTRRRRFAT